MILFEDRTGILQMPTNVSSFGDGRRQLAIVALGGWSITAVELPFAGASLHHPRVLDGRLVRELFRSRGSSKGAGRTSSLRVRANANR